MNIIVLTGYERYRTDPQCLDLVRGLQADGHNVSFIDKNCTGISSFNADLLLSVGGDGTFLSSSALAAPAGVPVVGVNMGRLGFLSENSPSQVLEAIRKGDFTTEDRLLLEVKWGSMVRYALNEVVVSRTGPAMLGVSATLDGAALPVYWADGLLVSTASGSTAYSLSAGGPIVLPSSKVLIITPVAPHNLNVRPLVVPCESEISLGFSSRNDFVNLSVDNYSDKISASEQVNIKVARFSLKRVRLSNSTFMKALSEKLYWGEDKRNETR